MTLKGHIKGGGFDETGSWNHESWKRNIYKLLQEVHEIVRLNGNANDKSSNVETFRHRKNAVDRVIDLR